MDTGDSFAYVKFVSDTSANAGGFSLSFEASVEGKCEIHKQKQTHMHHNSLTNMGLSVQGFCVWPFLG